MKLKSMLELQKELNDMTNGKGWENGIGRQGKKIDWRRCIWLEAAELVESYPWKHWKSIDASPDYENIKIEAVDIWHFVMSEALRLNTIENNGNIESLAERISSTSSYLDFASGKTAEKSDFYGEIETVEAFVLSVMRGDSIESLTASFFEVASFAGLDIDSLYNLYTGKNILNRFRQDNGYKNGTYIKIWNGREDNTVMQELLEKNTDISPDRLYKELERLYPREDLPEE